MIPRSLLRGGFIEPLTGRKFRFSNVDLAYLFFELEKRLGITFKNTTINEYGFSTIDKISKVIEQIEEEIS